MGLNIGVRVKRQLEEFMSHGCNPKGTSEEIDADFDAFLRSKFPDDAFNPSVTLNEQDEQYDFDVYMDYGWNGYDSTPMYLTILDYVLSHFSVDYGIDMHVYHAP